ncbi:MAG: class I SAM-dependent methyltransferase [Betaproteobacteria bacterium]|nr:class I SAM-dependent methyltransferase [Betaproteobacteria bacterium]
MRPDEYDRWYQTPRGSWIGERELALILRALAPRPGESLLDIGCGTGYFTRGFAGRLDGPVTGVDLNPEWVAFAARGARAGTSYAVADARRLPFGDRAFDLAISVTALCFIAEERTAIEELLRVTRRRFAIGLLNRWSLLWLAKGRGGGRGAYQGAHWHTTPELKSLFQGLPVRKLQFRTGIHLPSGGVGARALEQVWPTVLPTGGFLLVAGEVVRHHE